MRATTTLGLRAAQGFTAWGAPLARSSWDLGANLSARWGNAWTLAVGYATTTGAGAKGHAANVSVTWAF